MSELQSNTSVKTKTKLHICLLASQPPLANSIAKLINSDCYEVNSFNSMEDTIDFVIEYSEEIDCLILGFNEKPNSSIKKLWQAEVLLPAIIMEAKSDNHAIESIDLDEYTPDTEISNIYHEAEIRLYPIQLKEINSYIQLAINKFLDIGNRS